MPDGSAWLLQVSTDVADPATFEREVRALGEAGRQSRATPLLITLESLPPVAKLPKGIHWQPAAAWLLGDEAG